MHLSCEHYFDEYDRHLYRVKKTAKTQKTFNHWLSLGWYDRVIYWTVTENTNQQIDQSQRINNIPAAPQTLSYIPREWGPDLNTSSKTTPAPTGKAQ